MEYQTCNVQGVYITQTEQGNAPTVLLHVESNHFMPIYIGLWEAISITNALNHETLPRPITHDLFTDLFSRLDISMTALRIDALDDGVFFANLIIRQRDREEILDCRPSDGIAIALRLKAPILVSSDVVNKAAVEREELEKLVDIKSYL
ncbi:MAG: bifunctional nuclease family protein [Methanomicrobiales archaeon]|nr:bifunctional nuclease family protein [Methanomicrobiales archaeon]